MNKTQIYRNALAEMGYEYTIEEAKDIVYIMNKLIQISKMPMKVILEKIDDNYPNKDNLIKAIKTVKKIRKSK